MTVVAKMFVSERAETTYGGRVRLQAVCRGEDNKAWASATPSANVEMTILNDVAREQFEVGKEYLVTFERVPEERQGQPGME